MEREDLKCRGNEKSFRDIYLQAEIYRQGLTVEKDLDKAWNYYCDIADDSNPSRVNDDYYWRGCYRLGMALYYDSGSLASLKEAYRLVSVAKELYDKRDPNACEADISKEELYQNWQKLGREVLDYIRTIEEMPVVKSVRCIVDDVLSLTKGKIYNVLVEKRDYYELVDDEEEDVYIYAKSLFEDVKP